MVDAGIENNCRSRETKVLRHWPGCTPQTFTMPPNAARNWTRWLPPESGSEGGFLVFGSAGTMMAMQALFEEAAARKLAVNLHGCTIRAAGSGRGRTFSRRKRARHGELFLRITLHRESRGVEYGFTVHRNAIGPMDVTPIGCSPKKYVRTTTAAHELATAIILKSGLIHYAINPSSLSRCRWKR